MNKNTIRLPLYLSLAVIIGIVIGITMDSSTLFPEQKQGFKLQHYNKINDVINYIDNHYVDTVNKEKLANGAIEGMLENLDPHSVYIPAQDFNDANDPLEGNFEGIGVQFRIQKDTITVILPVQGGPAEKVGVRAGDRIVTINDEKVAGAGITNRDVMHKLKGKKGSKVEIGVSRKGENALIRFTIIRDVIPTFSIDIAFKPFDNIGYIKLSRFSETTYDEFMKALEDLLAQGMEKLILDLRGNSGGYLKMAIDIADEFLKKDELIVYTKGRKRESEYAYATDKGVFRQGELVVLIDEFSASASEILAGAIQDNDRGLVIGRRSFGKGLVQQQLRLYDKSAIRLTISRYYTPTGRSIQKPYNEGTEEYYHDFYSQFMEEGQLNPDTGNFSDSLKFVTKGGKVVYGGGGIMPDIYIPIVRDSTLKYYHKLANNGVIYQFSFDYTDINREELKATYNTAKEFVSSFEMDADAFDELLEYAEKKGIQQEGGVSEILIRRIKNLFKAYVGRNIYDNDAFYPIFLRYDAPFNRAIEELGR